MITKPTKIIVLNSTIINYLNIVTFPEQNLLICNWVDDFFLYPILKLLLNTTLFNAFTYDKFKFAHHLNH